MQARQIATKIDTKKSDTNNVLLHLPCTQITSVIVSNENRSNESQYHLNK